MVIRQRHQSNTYETIGRKKLTSATEYNISSSLRILESHWKERSLRIGEARTELFVSNQLCCILKNPLALFRSTRNTSNYDFVTFPVEIKVLHDLSQLLRLGPWSHCMR